MKYKKNIKFYINLTLLTFSDFFLLFNLIDNLFLTWNVTNFSLLNCFLLVNDFVYNLLFVSICSFVFERLNFLNAMIFVELFYFVISFLFVLNLQNTFNYFGEAIALIFIILAAAESTIGLSLLVFTKKALINNFNITTTNVLRG